MRKTNKQYLGQSLNWKGEMPLVSIVCSTLHANKIKKKQKGRKKKWIHARMNTADNRSRARLSAGISGRVHS